ncbi:MAG: GNAT family N-acetyltransferase [Micromonosporaceae bacterium]
MTVWFSSDDPGPKDYQRLLDEAVGSLYRGRFTQLDRLLADAHPTDPHAHLAFAAVTPKRQHEGIGTALIAHRHALLDYQGRAAYLEASSPASRDLYARLGYAETGNPLTLPGHDGPSFWPMWRNPNQHPTT